MILLYYTVHGSHDTIHMFKNYFITVFLVFNFQFSVSITISSIQTDPNLSITSLWCIISSFFLLLIAFITCKRKLVS